MTKPSIKLSVLIILLALTSCKKTRQCECKNANGVYGAGEIDASKRNAKKHCESLSTSPATECYLK
jgi:hypothetical protein